MFKSCRLYGHRKESLKEIGLSVYTVHKKSFENVRVVKFLIFKNLIHRC
jgi:hypothetical protein